MLQKIYLNMKICFINIGSHRPYVKIKVTKILTQY